MKEINDVCSFLESASESFKKALESASSMPDRSRYYLMQTKIYSDECDRIEKKLLKFFAFSSKSDFFTWRESLGNPDTGGLIEWTAGFLFKFYGDDHHYTLADKNGKEPKRVH